MSRFIMGFSVRWSWLAALSCLLCLGGEVSCDCTEEKMEIEGGHYTLSKQLTSGSMLVYHCPNGFYPYPTLTRLCQHNGSWRPAPRKFSPQICRVVECPDPFVLQNGNVSPPQEKYFVDNETTYECYSGYTMRGSSKRTCLANGKWSGSTPICSRDIGSDCADPGIPAGASRTGSMFLIDYTVKYTCNDNLFLVGTSERMCLENGQWTGQEPACYYKHTYDTSLEVSAAFGSAIKDSLTTLEPTDDIQEGRKIRISKNGTLNIYIAVDTSASIDEDKVNEAKGVIIKLIQKISSFTVTPNYEIIFFSSEIIEVVSILDFLDNNNKIDIEAKLKAFKVDNRNTGTDLNLAFKTFLERMAIIKERAGEEGFKEHRHVIIAFTDGAYNMGGSPLSTVAKIKNMVYMNHTGEQETHSREAFLDIYIFAIGNDIFDSDLQPLTAGSGTHYFRMKTINDLQETFDDIIDEHEVQGLCGLHKVYKDDVATEGSKRKRYPWWAFISIQNEGLPFNCIGSLVTPKFILTAAHCFKFGDLPEHVTVEIEDGGARVKKVKTFHTHPLYNSKAKEDAGVKEFYDYDVALIQLEEYVQISSSVRPICIPGTQETSDALKLVGNSTLKQQEQVLLSSHLEKLSFLTKQASLVKERHVQAKLGDNRDECIKHALQAPGITATNPKVPVTDNFLCTGGRFPSRDHIVCKGDSGGAVFKNYEQRTVQVAVVSWGTKDMCKSVGGNGESDDTSRDFHINLFRVVPFIKSILGNDNQDDYAPLKFLEN